MLPEWLPAANPRSQRERSSKASKVLTAYRRKVGMDEVLRGKRRSLVGPAVEQLRACVEAVQLPTCE